MIDVEQPGQHKGFAILALGFRPFFAGAALFSVLSVLVWMGLYVFNQQINLALPALSWHAHEMVFGYGMAVIAGFLLTAVNNWTGVQTLYGLPLLLLFLLWLVARVLIMVGGGEALMLAAVADVLFNALLVLALAWPVFKVRQFKQFGILSKILLLTLANLLFYSGVLGNDAWSERAGLYSGVYLIMALIFVLTRRVLPFFIERGTGQESMLTNRAWLDGASLIIFVVFWLADIAKPDSLLVALLAGLLCVLHSVRLFGWYVPGIWRQPLLWVLLLAYAAFIVGFALKVAVYVLGIPASLPLHAFTYGGIGLFTMGMMARVTLGHTGRSVLEPPASVAWMFALLVFGCVIRVGLPLFDASHTIFWMALSQCVWILAFSIFLWVFLPMLARPRPDGQPG